MKLVLLLTGILGLGASQVAAQSATAMQKRIEEIRLNYAPDARVAVFQVVADDSGVLTGKTNLPNAHEELIKHLRQEDVKFDDRIELLPAASLGGKVFGAVTISVANMRTKPGHSSEMSTQALLGTELKVWDKEGDWYLVQTPDNYLGWMDAGGFYRMDLAEFERWKQAPKVIVTAPYTFSHRKPETDALPVSDLVAGDIVKLKESVGDYFWVEYPEGKAAYVSKKDSDRYDRWLSKLAPTNETIVSTALKMMGIPYLWGGTSFKGMDCSGFTKTVFFLNGQVLARDASQQVHTGEPIEGPGFAKLEKGDLLFFGSPATESSGEKVTHVGIWIGNNQFIHASGQIRIGSVDPDSVEYDAFNTGRFLRARRMLGSSNGIRNLK
jgi:cell wall-associated NlpC family hydrolase